MTLISPDAPAPYPRAGVRMPAGELNLKFPIFSFSLAVLFFVFVAVYRRWKPRQGP